VLDLTRYVAGPVATALLSDLGADVIRIEPPGGADDRIPLPIHDGFHGGAPFTQVNRNKRSLCLDLASAPGRAAFSRLVKSANVIVCNLPNKQLDSLSLDFDTLKAIRPDLIFVHLTAFGPKGPYADRVGFDGIAQIMCGATYFSGDRGHPMKTMAPWVDMATGYISAFGVLAALRHRDRTGQGQKIEANLFRTAASIVNYFLIEQALISSNREGIGNRAPSGGPADLVRTRDGWIYVIAMGNPMFRRFARLVGKEQELTSDPRFADDVSRAEHGAALSEIANQWSERFTTEEALRELAKARVPAGALLSPKQVLSDPHAREQLFQYVQVEGLPQPVPYVKPPVNFSTLTAEIRRGPPRAGGNTEEVLREAGFSAVEIEALRNAKAISG
jgi:crotonobetainyl-CoA:carnitine CoA-transferase CaiB-like acyl-CoA transferase